MNKVDITDKIAVIVLDTTIWSGRRKLRPEDILIGAGGNLPPEDVASLGSKKICDPDELSIFTKLDGRMERACLAVGTRFLKGYAVPVDKLDELAGTLDAYVADFNTAKTEFLVKYDTAVEKWVSDHPGFEEPLRRAVLPVKVVANKLFCGYTVFRVGHAASEGAAATLDNQVGGLADQMYREVAKEAEDAFQHLIGHNGSLSRRSVRPLRRLHDKLEGLSFLDSGMDRLTGAIRSAADRLENGSGPVAETEFVGTLAIVSVLCSVDRMKAVTKGVARVADYALSPEPIVTEPKAEPVPDNAPSLGETGGETTEEPETASFYF